MQEADGDPALLREISSVPTEMPRKLERLVDDPRGLWLALTQPKGGD